jgi:hypothetical protein
MREFCVIQKKEKMDLAGFTAYTFISRILKPIPITISPSINSSPFVNVIDAPVNVFCITRKESRTKMNPIIMVIDAMCFPAIL